MYFFRIQKIVSENLSTRELCSHLFFNELKPVWGRAYIPIKPDKECIDQLVHLHDEWRAVKKIAYNRRSIPPSVEKIEIFKSKLNTLCDFSPPVVETQLANSFRRSANWKEDLEFLQLHRRYPQEGFISGIDRGHNTKEKKRTERELKASKATQSKRARLESQTLLQSNAPDLILR